MTTLKGVELGVLCHVADINLKTIHANDSHHALKSICYYVRSLDYVFGFDCGTILVLSLFVGETSICILGTKNDNVVYLILGDCFLDVVTVTSVCCCPIINQNTCIVLVGRLAIHYLISNAELPWVVGIVDLL